MVAAAVELVIRSGLADDSYPWSRHGVPGSQWPEDAVDFHTLATVARQTPGEDGLVVRLAVGLGLGVEISPAVLGQVDDDRRAYLLAAIAREWPPDRGIAATVFPRPCSTTSPPARGAAWTGSCGTSATRAKTVFSFDFGVDYVLRSTLEGRQCVLLPEDPSATLVHYVCVHGRIPRDTRSDHE